MAKFDGWKYTKCKEIFISLLSLFCEILILTRVHMTKTHKYKYILLLENGDAYLFFNNNKLKDRIET